MNFQAKVLVVIVPAVIASMVLIFSLTSWSVNRTIDSFHSVYAERTSKQMKARATERITSDASSLEGIFNSILLRLKMFHLLKDAGAVSVTADGLPDLSAVIGLAKQVPGMTGKDESDLNYTISFGMFNGKEYQVYCKNGESNTLHLETIPRELSDFAEHQVKDIGALIIPRRNTGYIWAAYYSAGNNSHTVSAYRIDVRKYLKQIDFSSDNSCSMLVFGNREIGVYDNLAPSEEISSRVKSGMLNLASRLIPLQNSRAFDEETLENNRPEMPSRLWEASATTLKMRTVPTETLRLVKALPFPDVSAFSEEPTANRIMIVEFFIILAGLLIFFPPLIFIIRKMAASLRKLCKTASDIARGELPEERRADKCIEMAELSSSLNHLSDKLNGMQMRLKKSHEREMLARDTAEISNRKKSTLLKIMIAELLEPLNLISGFTGLLIHKFKHQTETEAVFRKISDESHTVARMVRSLGELSALDHSEMEPAYTEFDIGEIITKIRDNCIASSTEKHVQFEMHCSDLPGKIVSDKHLLLSILRLAAQTLLFYAPQKSKILIQCQDYGKEIEIELSDVKNTQHTSIAELFNEYEKTSGGTYIPPGYGSAILNLTVLKAKAKLLGVTFEAKTSENANSVFSISVMKNSVSDYSSQGSGQTADSRFREDVEKRTRLSLSTGDPGKTRKLYLSGERIPEVLIAGHSENAVSMLAMMLGSEKYHVVSANSPEEVILKLGEHHYDLLLLDLNLQPGLCASLIETIRSKVSDNIVIFTFSHELSKPEEAGLRESGADRCLIKPVGVDLLVGAIHDLTVS